MKARLDHRLVAWLALAGCNQIYGLDPTRLRDENPLHCPAFGEPLVVGTRLRQVTTEDCYDYATSADADESTALCRMPGGRYEVRVGPIGRKLEPVALAPSTMYPDAARYAVRLSADGRELWVAIDDNQGNLSAHAVYRRSGSSWSYSTTVPFLASRETLISAPTRGPDRRVFVDDQYTNDALVEFVEDAPGAWREHDRYTVADLGVDFFEVPSLSADGLRLLFNGEANNGGSIGWFFTDRLTVDDRFGPGRFVREIPPDPYYLHLSDDCTRLYFPALGSVFYLGAD